MAAALPETSPGAKTSFTRSYTAQEPDHLEIYAFLNCYPSIVLPIAHCAKGTNGILCVYPVQKVGIHSITCSLAYHVLNVNPLSTPHERP